MIGGQEGQRLFKRGRVEIGIGRGAVHDAHLIPGQVHFLGHQRGKGGVDALPHLGPGGDDGDAGAVDQDIGGQRGTLAPQQRVGIGAAVSPGAKGSPARNGDGPEQKGAAGDGSDTAHRSGPFQCGGGGVDGGPDARIGAAAAQVAGHRGVDVVIRWLGRFGQQ